MATIVIVHGMWSGGWYFQPVARRLRAAGHEVYTPTLTGIGEREHLGSPDTDPLPVLAAPFGRSRSPPVDALEVLLLLVAMRCSSTEEEEQEAGHDFEECGCRSRGKRFPQLRFVETGVRETDLPA